MWLRPGARGRGGRGGFGAGRRGRGHAREGEFRVEKAGIVHVPVGKASFDAKRLTDNVNAILDTVMRAKPATAKGTYLKGVSVSSTMGPGIRLDTAAISALHK